MFNVLRNENITEVKADAVLLKSAHSLQTALNNFNIAQMSRSQSMAYEELKSVLSKQIGYLEKFALNQSAQKSMNYMVLVIICIIFNWQRRPINMVPVW
jgi:hypothetical protein